MKKQVISNCPVCSHDLVITSVYCERCDISISGQFTLSKFDYLSKEQQYFVENFIKNQGSIKAIEKEMNISYPTVKKMLVDVIIALGYENVEDQSRQESTAKDKHDILKRVASKELSVDEAIALIKQNESKK